MIALIALIVLIAVMMTASNLYHITVYILYIILGLGIIYTAML